MRSNLPEVRNPLLALPAAQDLAALLADQPELRRTFKRLCLQLKAQAREKELALPLKHQALEQMMSKLNYERIPTRVWARQWFKEGDDPRVVFAKSLGGQSWLSNQRCANTANGYQVVMPGFWLVMDPDLLVMSDDEFKAKYRPASPNNGN